MPSIAIEPKRADFTSKREPALREALERVDRLSDLREFGIADLLLSADGITRGGFRYTTWGLYQVCRLICDGLYRLVLELTATDHPDDFESAVCIFNKILASRFRDRLQGYRFLVDAGNNTIDAALGGKYKLFRNLHLYNEAPGLLSSLPAKFFSSRLDGRWFMLRYYLPIALDIEDEAKWFVGVHFSNHEGGRASFRVANSLMRVGQEIVTGLPPFTRSRCTWHSIDITRLLGKLVNQSLVEPIPLEQLRLGVPAARKRLLGLGLATEEEEVTRRSRLATQVGKRSLWNKSLASRVIASAILRSADDTRPRPAASLASKDLASRSVLDLSVATGREAKKRDIAGREAMEQFAYSLWTGKIKIR